MDQMGFDHSSVVGISSKTTWSTTASWKLDGTELWCACGFSGSENAPHLGRKFIQFLESLQPSNPQILHQALQQFLQESDDSTVVSYALAFVQNRRIILFTAGYGSVALARQNRWRWLIPGNQVNAVLEGDVSPGDTLLLGTARIPDIFPTGDHLSDAHPDTVVADLLPKLQRVDQNGELSALIMRVPEKEGQNKEEASALAPLPRKKTVETQEGIEDIEMVEETVPAPLARVQNRSHLISPEKIRAGITAAEGEGEPGVSKTRRKLPSFALPSIDWKKLHVFRVVLVIVVIAIVVALVAAMRIWRINEEYEEVIVPLEQMTQEVQSFGSDQRFAQRESAQSLLERLQATKVSYTANRQKLAQMTGTIQRIYDETSGEKTLVNLPTYFDFRLVTSNFLAAKAARDRDTVVFLDTAQNQALSLDLSTKKNERVELTTVTGTKDIAALTGALAFLTDTGIVKTSLSGTEPQPVGSLNGVTEPFLLESFGDSVYILDRAGQQIWRLNTAESSASPSAWLRAARGVSIPSVTSMVINGSIWLGTENGDVFKLTRGEREDFSVNGLVEPFTTSLLLAVNPEGQKLVVVEPAKNRIVIIDKNTGEYLQQILSDQVGAVTDLFLSEDESALFLTAGSVVYRVEI